jgi:hypothetical protein
VGLCDRVVFHPILYYCTRMVAAAAAAASATVMCLAERIMPMYGTHNITPPVLAPKKICVYIIYTQKKNLFAYMRIAYWYTQHTTGTAGVRSYSRILGSSIEIFSIKNIAKWKTGNPGKIVLPPLLTRWVMITQKSVLGDIWDSYTCDCSTTESYQIYRHIFMLLLVTWVGV